jgi:hypothetical protein
LLGGPPPAPRPIGVRLADLPDDGEVPLFRETSDFGDPQTASTGMPNLALAEDEPPTPEPTPPEPPEPGKPDPEKPGPETPEPPPEGSDCEELYDAFFEAQDERDSAQQEVGELQDALNEVEAEIEDLRQQIDDAERLAMEEAGKGWRDGTIFPLPPAFGKAGKAMGKANKAGQGTGALEGSENAMEYLTTVLYPKRSELEAGRQALLKQLDEAEKALAEAQSVQHGRIIGVVGEHRLERRKQDRVVVGQVREIGGSRKRGFDGDRLGHDGSPHFCGWQKFSC